MTQRRSGWTGDSHNADIFRTVPQWYNVGEANQREDNDASPANALHRSPSEQNADAMRDGAQDCSDGKQENRCKQTLGPAEDVTERSSEGHGDSNCQEVARADPETCRGRGVESSDNGLVTTKVSCWRRLEGHEQA